MLFAQKFSINLKECGKLLLMIIDLAIEIMICLGVFILIK